MPSAVASSTTQWHFFFSAKQKNTPKAQILPYLCTIKSGLKNIFKYRYLIGYGTGMYHELFPTDL
jgi:hypothetical protein